MELLEERAVVGDGVTFGSDVAVFGPGDAFQLGFDDPCVTAVSVLVHQLILNTLLATGSHFKLQICQ